MKLYIIKKWEGFKAEPYLCPAGVATIGYGTTIYQDGRKVSLNDHPITERYASELLEQHCIKIKRDILYSCKSPLNINQISALVSFVYNVGIGAFKRSTMLKKLNYGDLRGASLEFEKWDKATVKGKKVVLPGLTKRRHEEKELFLQAPYKEQKKNIVNENKNITIFSIIKNFFKKLFGFTNGRN